MLENSGKMVLMMSLIDGAVKASDKTLIFRYVQTFMNHYLFTTKCLVTYGISEFIVVLSPK